MQDRIVVVDMILLHPHKERWHDGIIILSPSVVVDVAPISAVTGVIAVAGPSQPTYKSVFAKQHEKKIEKKINK